MNTLINVVNLLKPWMRSPNWSSLKSRLNKPTPHTERHILFYPHTQCQRRKPCQRRKRCQQQKSSQRHRPGQRQRPLQRQRPCSSPLWRHSVPRHPANQRNRRRPPPPLRNTRTPTLARPPARITAWVQPQKLPVTTGKMTTSNASNGGHLGTVKSPHLDFLFPWLGVEWLVKYVVIRSYRLWWSVLVGWYCSNRNT